MEVPEKAQSFSEEELNLIISVMNDKGIITDSEEPLITHYMDFKWWGNSCINYVRKLGDIDYEIRIDEDNSKGPIRFLYDPARYSRKEAAEYAIDI